MPRIDRFDIRIETGSTGTTDPVHFQFNGHTIGFEEHTGGTGAGEIFDANFELRSVAHSLVLNGPETGEWEVKELTVTYHFDDREPYALRFGEVQLNAQNAVNIWRDPPRPTFDV